MSKRYNRSASILTQQLDLTFHLPKKPFNSDISKPGQHSTMLQCNLPHGADGSSRQQEGYSHLHHIYNQPQETDTPGRQQPNSVPGLQPGDPKLKQHQPSTWLWAAPQSWLLLQLVSPLFSHVEDRDFEGRNFVGFF